MFGKLVKKENIKAVILVGRRDFGRCPLASCILPALWPIAGRPVLERLLVHLANEGIKQVSICTGSDGSVLADSIRIDDRLDVSFVDEELPVGTAGCIRDAVGKSGGELILVLPAGIINPPKVGELLDTHIRSRADLTIMFNPSDDNDTKIGRTSGIYVCDSSVIKYIPKAGYADIKEGLVPELLRNGRQVHADVLQEQAGGFRDSREYLYAVSKKLINDPDSLCDSKTYKNTGTQDVYVAVDAKVDSSARILGPVIVMDGARISNDAVVLGPTVIGRKVYVGSESVVINSVLWEDSRTGSNSQVRHCVLDYQSFVPDNATVERQSVLLKSKSVLQCLSYSTAKTVKNPAQKLWKTFNSHLGRIDGRLPDMIKIHKKNIKKLIMPVIVLAAFLWSYKSGFRDLWNIWQRSDEYSSGLLVPFLAVYILWARKNDILKHPVKPCIWGLFAFILAQMVRLLGLFLMFSSAERLSIVLSIAALVLFLFGWKIFKRVATVLLFLCLMLPLPNQVQASIAQPLQRWATTSAVFCLETMGYEVLREGNIIHIGQSTVAVAEACNGLRMVTAFFVTSGLVVLLVKRAWWEKLIVLLSSLPIALLCNTIRLSVTAVFFTILEGEQWEKIFHDFGGYAMMPLALAATVLEFWLLTRLTSLPESREAIIITRHGS